MSAQSRMNEYLSVAPVNFRSTTNFLRKASCILILSLLLSSSSSSIVKGQQQEQFANPHPFLIQNQAWFRGLDGLSMAFLTRFLNEIDQRVSHRRQRGDEKLKGPEMMDGLSQRLLPTSFRSPLQEKYRSHIENHHHHHDVEGRKHCHDENCNHCKKEAEQIFFDLSQEQPKQCSEETPYCTHHHEAATTTAADSTMQDLHLSVECICGSCNFDFKIDPCTPMEYCHCQGCRKYSVGPFASRVLVAKDNILQTLRNCDDMPFVKSESYRCLNSTAPVYERWHCKHCLAPIASVEIDNDGTATDIQIAAGAIVDKSIPDNLALWWHSEEGQKHMHDFQKATWLNEVSGLDVKNIPKDFLTIHGGCACGNVRYVAIKNQFLNFQHCYCHLCRQCSGSAFQTWVHVPMTNFAFVEKKGLKLVRTTLQGQRHMCKGCGGTLTIQYDKDEKDSIWIAAGGIDDDTWPTKSEELRKRLKVIHICCEWMQPWYVLPDDMQPRKKLAA